MRVRIHKPAYKLDFEGEPAVWNMYLRPLVGGPEAPPDPVPPPAPTTAAPAAPTAAVAPGPMLIPAAAPVVRTYAPAVGPSVAGYAQASPAPTAGGPRTFYVAREPREARPSYPDSYEAGAERDDRPPWRRRGGPEPEARVEASSDPKTLYARLLELGSRRAEKDAVLAAVWFVGKGEKEVHEKEIEAHFAEHGGPDDVKVRPVALKHINRTKLLEPGTAVGLVRLTAKGREQIRLLCGV